MRVQRLGLNNCRSFQVPSVEKSEQGVQCYDYYIYYYILKKKLEILAQITIIEALAAWCRNR
jgi:hypothetical protein